MIGGGGSLLDENGERFVDKDDFPRPVPAAAELPRPRFSLIVARGSRRVSVHARRPRPVRLGRPRAAQGDLIAPEILWLMEEIVAG